MKKLLKALLFLALSPIVHAQESQIPDNALLLFTGNGNLNINAKNAQIFKNNQGIVYINNEPTKSIFGKGTFVLWNAMKLADKNIDQYKLIYVDEKDLYKRYKGLIKFYNYAISQYEDLLTNYSAYVNVDEKLINHVRAILKSYSTCVEYFTKRLQDIDDYEMKININNTLTKLVNNQKLLASELTNQYNMQFKN